MYFLYAKYAFKIHQLITTKKEWLLLEKKVGTFMYSILLKMCSKFKVDRLSCLYWSSSNVHNPQTFPQRNSRNHENCYIKFPLNIFSDQITICQMFFEIHTSLTSEGSFFCFSKKVNIWIPVGYFLSLISFFSWNEVKKKSSIKEDRRFIVQVGILWSWKYGYWN